MRKVRIGTIFGLPAQNSDPSFARAIPGLSGGSPRHCHRCARVRSIFCTCTFIVDAVWKMVHRDAFEKWTKETFLSGKKVGSKVLTRSQGEQVRSELCAGQSEDCPDPNFAHNIYIYMDHMIYGPRDIWTIHTMDHLR